MRLLRSAAPLEAQSAMLVAQREAVRRTACETPDTRREHFVWPTGARSGFYWFAVEAMVSTHPDDFDRLPAVVERDGFARSAPAAHRAAERAFDDPRIARSLVRIARRSPAHRERPESLLMHALRALVLLALAVGILVGAAFLVGQGARSEPVQTVGALIMGGLFGGILHYWIEGHR